MSRSVDIIVRARRDILSDKSMVIAGTEGHIASITPLIVTFDVGYYAPEGRPIQEDVCRAYGLTMDDIEVLGAIDKDQGGRA